MNDPLTPEQQRQIDDLLRGGRRIDALKLHREFVGSDLREAKEAVEARAAQLNQQSPGSVPAQTGCMSVIILAIGILAGLAWTVVRLTA